MYEILKIHNKESKAWTFIKEKDVLWHLCIILIFIIIILFRLPHLLQPLVWADESIHAFTGILTIEDFTRFIQGNQEDVYWQVPFFIRYIAAFTYLFIKNLNVVPNFIYYRIFITIFNSIIAIIPFYLPGIKNKKIACLLFSISYGFSDILAANSTKINLDVSVAVFLLFHIIFLYYAVKSKDRKQHNRLMTFSFILFGMALSTKITAIIFLPMTIISLLLFKSMKLKLVPPNPRKADNNENNTKRDEIEDDEITNTEIKNEEVVIKKNFIQKYILNSSEKVISIGLFKLILIFFGTIFIFIGINIFGTWGPNFVEKVIYWFHRVTNYLFTHPISVLSLLGFISILSSIIWIIVYNIKNKTNFTITNSIQINFNSLKHFLLLKLDFIKTLTISTLFFIIFNFPYFMTTKNTIFHAITWYASRQSNPTEGFITFMGFNIPKTSIFYQFVGLLRAATILEYILCIFAIASLIFYFVKMIKKKKYVMAPLDATFAIWGLYFFFFISVISQEKYFRYLATFIPFFLFSGSLYIQKLFKKFIGLKFESENEKDKFAKIKRFATNLQAKRKYSLILTTLGIIGILSLSLFNPGVKYLNNSFNPSSLDRGVKEISIFIKENYDVSNISIITEHFEIVIYIPEIFNNFRNIRYMLNDPNPNWSDYDLMIISYGAFMSEAEALNLGNEIYSTQMYHLIEINVTSLNLF